MLSFTLLAMVLLLLDCWRSAKLLPMFGSVRKARVIWSLSFLLTNPFMLLLYMAIARKQWVLVETPEKRDRVVLIGLFLSALLQLPPLEPSYTARERPGIEFTFFPTSYVGAIGWSMGGGGGQPRPESWVVTGAREVRITSTRDPIAWKVAQEIARRFRQEHWTARVEPNLGVADASIESREQEVCIEVDGSGMRTHWCPMCNWIDGELVIYQTYQSFPKSQGGEMPSDQLVRRREAHVKGMVTRVGVCLGDAYYGAITDYALDHFDDSYFDSMNDHWRGY